MLVHSPLNGSFLICLLTYRITPLRSSCTCLFYHHKSVSYVTPSSQEENCRHLCLYDKSIQEKEIERNPQINCKIIYQLALDPNFSNSQHFYEHESFSMYRTVSDENFVVSLILGVLWEAFFGYLFVCFYFFFK